MFKSVTPHLRLTSILDLNASRLSDLGIRHLLVDMDCTLKDYRAAMVGAEAIEWSRQLRGEGISLCVFSNGGAHRISRLSAALGVPFIAKALKPFPFGCRRATRELGFDSKHTAVVGDQVFADVMAGRLAGMFTILVTPTTTDEPWFTRLKRPLERWVLRRLEKHGCVVGKWPDEGSVQSPKSKVALTPNP